ncbi:histidine phosphatase family protein [Cumulibacter manganitolerans]|uniref:histidine phosphatase family protein n=1 Tax=Cumulibacter manganitolerans TaxID=1884992 RepID=UPI001294BF88|nr:histidine phosphatase family protein [Cumulibacter manganitolerans]
MHDVDIHLVRHGQSTWNVERRLQGQTAHPPLTEAGRADAARAAATLDALVGGAAAQLVTSDLLRARQTAEVIAARLGITAVPDAGLREQHLGSLQGRLTSELVAEPVPDHLHISEIRHGGGESLADVHHRLSGLLERLLPHAPGHLILVTHGDTLRVARAVLAGCSHREVEWDVVPNGAVITVRAAVSPVTGISSAGGGIGLKSE